MAKKRRRSKSRVPPEPWEIRYFRRHPEDDPEQRVPAQEFRRACPAKVRPEIDATHHAAAAGPPPRFKGGLRWQPMHGDMTGWFEVRVQGSGRLYRVFCLLEREAEGLLGPSIVLITGLWKASETSFSKADYARVRGLGTEYRARSPRSVI